MSYCVSSVVYRVVSSAKMMNLNTVFESSMSFMYIAEEESKRLMSIMVDTFKIIQLTCLIIWRIKNEYVHTHLMLESNIPVSRRIITIMADCSSRFS